MARPEAPNPPPPSSMKVPIATLCFAAVASLGSSGDSPAHELIATSRPLVIAHRGWSGIAPENTLPAFQLAIEAESDLVELDYHHSSDGVPVVIHDPTLARTTDASGRWPGETLTLASRSRSDLEPLDAGTWFHPRFAGTRLPTLEEALEFIQRSSITLIERKAGDAATLARILRDRKLENRVIVQSFDWDFLRALRTELPDQILGALGPRGRTATPADRMLGPAQLDEIVAVGARVAVWNQDINRASVTAAHARGLKVWVYTIDDPGAMRRLLELGVDGIISNQPARVWRTLATSRQP